MSNNEVKSESVMNFVNSIIEAFDAGFIDSHELTIGAVYSMARHHVEINYEVIAPDIFEKWGEETANSCLGRIDDGD